jgi:hypothetical protein
MMTISSMMMASGNEGMLFLLFSLFNIYLFFFNTLPFFFSLETIWSKRSCDFGDFDAMMTISSMMTASEDFW